MRSRPMSAVVMAGFLTFISAELLCAPDDCKLGSEALERRDLQQAEALLKQCMAAYPAQLSPYIQLCAVYQLQGKPDELHRVASAGLKKFPEEKRFYLTVGSQAGREKRFERALEVFSEGFRRWPDDQRFRDNLASSHLGIGMKFLDEGKNREAEKHLRQATELAKDDIEAHLN